MNLLKWLFGSRKPALNKPVVSGSLQSEKITEDAPIENKTDWKYTCHKCGKGNNDTILAAIHRDYCNGNER